MKKLLLGCLLSLTTCAMADVPQKGVITLTETNHAALTGEVDDNAITDIILKIESSKEKTIYLFINSPGGSVLAGNRLIQYMATSDKSIICVAQIAISMAHQILQHCPHRIGTPDNVMMQHRMTAGVQGNVDEMSGLNNVFRQMEIQLNTQSAKRVGVSLEEFFKKVNLNWWTYGPDSKAQGMIDAISHVKCAPSLYLKETSKVVIIMGIFRVPVIQNGCPLVPLRVDESKLKGVNSEEVEKLKNILIQPITAISKP